jgi:hypothetical protein
MKSLSFFGAFLALVAAIECFSDDTPDGVIKVENFYPPEGYQPVEGYEPPNYKPYKRIMEALNQAGQSSSNSNSHKKSSKNSNKFIDRQTNIDVYGKPFYHASQFQQDDVTIQAPLEHRINNNFHQANNIPINQYQNKVPVFNNHGIQTSFDLNPPIRPISNGYYEPRTSTNTPFYMVNLNQYLNAQRESAKPATPIRVESVYPFGSQRPSERPPFEPATASPQLPVAWQTQRRPEALPPHMINNFNSNQNHLRPVNNGFEHASQPLPGFHPQEPFFTVSPNFTVKPNLEALNTWKSFVTMSTILPTSPFRKPSMEPNWRRTPPPKRKISRYQKLRLQI